MTQITFGKGIYGVDIGTYGGSPAVFITPNEKPGPVGERVPLELQGNLERDTLLDGETVLIFPTRFRCKEVADALVGSKMERWSKDADPAEQSRRAAALADAKARESSDKNGDQS